MLKPMILEDEFLEFCQQILYNGVFVELAGTWQGGLILYVFKGPVLVSSQSESNKASGKRLCWGAALSAY